MKNFLQNSWNIIQTVWNVICGISAESVRLGKNLLIIESCLVILGLIGLIGGFAVKLVPMVAATGVICALVFLVIWKEADLVVSLLNGGKGLSKAGKTAEGVSKELRKLVGPILTTSLAFSFVAAFVLRRGLGNISLGEISTILASCLFVVIFTYYIDSTRKWSGWVMAAILAYLWICHFVWPVQTLTDLMAKRSANWAMNKANEIKEMDLAILPAGTQIYAKNLAGEIVPNGATTKETRVKIISRIEDPTSKEGLYEAVLPGNNGLYIGGKKILVPEVLAKAMKVKETTAKTNVPKIAFDQEYVGQGWGEQNWVPTAEFGKDIAIGDRILVTGDRIQVWNINRWHGYQGKHETINYSGTSGSLGVKAEKGEKFKVTIIKRT